MTSPIDFAWAVMKAPIDSHGYSDLPRDMFDENVGIMSNQEEQDWYDFIAKLPFDMDNDLTDEEQQMIVGIFNRLYEGDAHILHPDDDFDARGMIFIEDYGEVPKEDYYNAEWWWNHPHGHINSIRDEYESIEELQADLDKERGAV